MTSPPAARSAVLGARAARMLFRHRRWIAALALLTLVLSVVDVVARPPAPGRYIVIATRSLPIGQSVGSRDVRTAEFPDELIPEGALDSAAEAIGGTLASAVGRGQVVTRWTLVGPALREAVPAGAVIVPLPLPDGRYLDLLSPGQRIDVLTRRTCPDETAPTPYADGREVLPPGTGPDDGSVEAECAPVAVAASSAVVVTTTGRGEDGGLFGASSSGDPLALIAVTADEARTLAALETSTMLIVLTGND